tara:strand:- start:574 stop:687 length:114 start_codon:yes stop_codon:yes gene_type:complete
MFELSDYNKKLLGKLIEKNIYLSEENIDLRTPDLLNF